MTNNQRQFYDRTEAGQLLSQELSRFLHDRKAFVLAIPPNGVPIAAAIATELDAPMDVVVARRMVAEGRPDETLGAITPDRTLVVNPALVARLKLSDAQVDQIATREWAESQGAMKRLRRGRAVPHLAGYTAVIVDEGLTTGYTAMSAIISVRKMEPDSIILAAPVSSLAAMDLLRDYVDSLLALEINSADDFAVAQYYRFQDDLTEHDLISLLDNHWRERDIEGYTETF